MGYCVSIVESEKEIATKTDLFIADFHTFSGISPEILFQHKVKILLLLTDCLPKIQDQRLFKYISKGLIGKEIMKLLNISELFVKKIPERYL
ncbi:MAG: hypothetical protein DYG83_09960 [Candidatus Brocadia sp. AMX2]|uniref:Uncharacterized protein n=1 Tax=Candidatus Brocadia sinica JPN1 TaxID=1197129 RepID=A0ABQ0K278_9BACT|nr:MULTISPECIES: hypothetical protein [Brocadia]KXK25697.1 MAG: hypothetical protein UZ01_03281 [Candidatus Brocadia sinica]MBC6932699.1 hypothetical protein [Candidatus Brocadia sp.]MBL1169590.1 hypothetical protein [Candidatus Brocadia sp. AMX1]NOG42978.1 hypothetical protein [Planctomycetota bacterium]KAA0243192.1 MAG: hypothetical protein EDM70_11665 [Candidatus Brocadia sp. AMX2]